jgi:hypothetical protein
MQTLALNGHDGYEQARRWEPKRLRLRLLPIPARHARTGRRRLLHLAATAPFTALALQALDALARLGGPAAAPAPGWPPALPAPTTATTPGPWNRRPPSDLGRSVTPRCDSHAHAGPESRRPSR